MTLTTFAAPAPPVRRDGRGRYRVLDATDTKLVSLTRATTYIAAVDDKEGLIGWHARTVIAGLASDPQLAAELATLDLTDKAALGAFERRCFERGGGTARRDRGTDMHTVLEDHFTGRPTRPEHATWLARIDELLAHAGLAPLEDWIEAILVNYTLGVAGTADVFLTNGTEVFVADLKTGSFKPGACAAQLALYAQMEWRYHFGAAEDGSEDRRDPLPSNLSRARGYVLHAPLDTSEATLHAIDLVDGARIVEVAGAVRDVRRLGQVEVVHSVRTELPTLDLPDDPFAGLPQGDPPVDLLAQRRAWLRGRAEVVKGHEGAYNLASINWPPGCPPLTEDTHTDAQLDAICAVLDQAEALMGAPFPEQADPKVSTARATVPADHPDVVALLTGNDELPVDLRLHRTRIDRARRGRLTRAELDEELTALDAARNETEQRRSSIKDTLDLYAGDRDSLLAAVGLRHFELQYATAVDAQFLADLVDAIGLGWVDPVSLDVTSAGVAAAIDHHGGRRTLLTAARACADRLQIPRPASCDDAAGNLRLWCALACQ